MMIKGANMKYDWEQSVGRLRGGQQRMRFLEEVYSALLKEQDKTNADLFPYNSIVALEQIVGRLARDEFDEKKRLGIVKADYTFDLRPYYDSYNNMYSYEINIHGSKYSLFTLGPERDRPERIDVRVHFNGEEYHMLYELRSFTRQRVYSNGGIVYCEDIKGYTRRSIRHIDSLKVSGVKKTSSRGQMRIAGHLYNLGVGYASQPVIVFLDGKNLQVYDFAKRRIRIISSKDARQAPRQ